MKLEKSYLIGDFTLFVPTLHMMAILTSKKSTPMSRMISMIDSFTLKDNRKVLKRLTTNPKDDKQDLATFLNLPWTDLGKELFVDRLKKLSNKVAEEKSIPVSTDLGIISNVLSHAFNEFGPTEDISLLQDWVSELIEVESTIVQNKFEDKKFYSNLIKSYLKIPPELNSPVTSMSDLEKKIHINLVSYIRLLNAIADLTGRFGYARELFDCVIDAKPSNFTRAFLESFEKRAGMSSTDLLVELNAKGFEIDQSDYLKHKKAVHTMSSELFDAFIEITTHDSGFEGLCYRIVVALDRFVEPCKKYPELRSVLETLPSLRELQSTSTDRFEALKQSLSSRTNCP